MAEYYENRIVLSAEESAAFRQKMNHPDVNVERNRDRNLGWIAGHMDIQMTSTGFVVTVSDDDTEETDVVTTMGTYQIVDQKESIQSAHIILGHAEYTKKVIPWKKLRTFNYKYKSEPNEQASDIIYKNSKESTYFTRFGVESCA